MFGRVGEEAPFYGRHHSEETKLKMSKERKGDGNPMYGRGDERRGKKNSFYGKKHTEESKCRISQSLKDHPAHNKGKPCSPETKQKLSELAKLRTGSKASRYGKSCSSETKKKIGEAAKKRWAKKTPEERLHSIETRKRMSEAQRKRWAKTTNSS